MYKETLNDFFISFISVEFPLQLVRSKIQGYIYYIVQFNHFDFSLCFFLLHFFPHLAISLVSPDPIPQGSKHFFLYISLLYFEEKMALGKGGGWLLGQKRKLKVRGEN